MATCRPVPLAMKAIAPTASPEAGGRPATTRARSRPNRPISTAPTGVGSSTMRPLDSQEASPEPSAMPTENTASSSVTTVSVPLSALFTSTGSSDSTTTPTSQNQLTITEPRHSRVSAQMSRSSAAVERATFGSTRRPGSPSPVRGIIRAESQQSTAKTITSAAKAPPVPPAAEARPAVMVPSRIARKVAPSTSALPAGSSSRFRWSGRMPYLIGPNSAAITPKRPSATNSTGTEWSTKPSMAMPAAKISANFRRRAISALS